MPGSVTFTPTEQDWIAANRLWLARTRWRRWMRWFLAAVLVLTMVDVVMQVAISGSLADALLDVAVPVGVIVLVAASYGLTPLTIGRGVRQQFAQRRTMGDVTDAEWDAERLSVANAGGSTTVRWTDLHRWVHDDAVFAFLLTDRMILMIPKRAMSTEAIADLASTATAFGPKTG